MFEFWYVIIFSVLMIQTCLFFFPKVPFKENCLSESNWREILAKLESGVCVKINHEWDMCPLWMQLRMSPWFRSPPLWSGHKAPAIAIRYFWFFVYKHIMLSIITIFAFRAVKAFLFVYLFVWVKISQFNSTQTNNGIFRPRKNT